MTITPATASSSLSSTHHGGHDSRWNARIGHCLEIPKTGSIARGKAEDNSNAFNTVFIRFPKVNREMQMKVIGIFLE